MLLTAMILLLFVFIMLGMDIAFSVGAASLAYIVATQFGDRPINPVLFVQELTAGVDSFALLAIPMFIFAGELMTKSGVTVRLINLASSLVGHRPGGLANTGITANLFMAGISGSAVADAAAVGSVLVPEMKRRGYSSAYAAGVIAAAASMGPIIPPSILFILLGSIVNISVGQLFIAGIVPGFVMYFAMLATSAVMSRRLNLPVEERVTGAARRSAIIAGILPLGAPVMIVLSKIFGIATPTESAALVVVYTLALGVFAYRSMTLRRHHQRRGDDDGGDQPDFRLARRAGRPRPGADRCDAGDLDQPLCAAAADQRRAADPRHHHGTAAADADPGADPVPDAGRHGRRSDPLRRRDGAEPRARHGHAAGGPHPVRDGADRQCRRDGIVLGGMALFPRPHCRADAAYLRAVAVARARAIIHALTSPADQQGGIQ
jgi:hypothetical protein